MPSGRLCRAMANTNSQMRPQRSWPGPQGPVLSCSWGVNWSSPSISSTPSAMPITTTPAPRGLLPMICAAAVQPGRSREKALAASIIPAAIPSRLSSTRCGNPRSTSAGSAPSAVAANATPPPSSARRRPGAATPPASCATLSTSSASTASSASVRPSAADRCEPGVVPQQPPPPGPACGALDCRSLHAFLGPMRSRRRPGSARFCGRRPGRCRVRGAGRSRPAGCKPLPIIVNRAA